MLRVFGCAVSLTLNVVLAYIRRLESRRIVLQVASKPQREDGRHAQSKFQISVSADIEVNGTYIYVLACHFFPLSGALKTRRTMH